MPTRDEIETTITWTANDEMATVYSLMPKIWRACIKAGATEIRLDEGIRDGKKEARTFLVDPACIRIRPRRKATEAQKAALKAARRGSKEDQPPF